MYEILMSALDSIVLSDFMRVFLIGSSDFMCLGLNHS